MIQFEVDPEKKLQEAIQNAIKEIGDLTVPYKLMARSWFKGNLSIFDEGRAGPGKYADLTSRYKKQKQRNLGFVYPILKSSGKLERSITNPADADSVNYIINGKFLFLGTKVTTKKGAPYAIFLQKGTAKVPPRPFVLIGAEQVANRTQNQRLENWVATIEDYVFKKLGSIGPVRKF